jgi:hypothetical protein
MSYHGTQEPANDACMTKRVVSWTGLRNHSLETRITELRCPRGPCGGGGNKVSGRYPSRNLGVTIQFESHRGVAWATSEARQILE